MSRRNSHTCPDRGVKLFGVRLTEGSIRKSASMGNLSHYSGSRLGGHGGIGSNNPGSPSDGMDHGVGDYYASEDFVPGSSSSHERKKGNPWTEEEHRMFLLGLQKLGKGDWRGISRNYVTSRTPTQVASHAQKYFIRQFNVSRRKRRSSLFDMVPDEVTEVMMESQELQAKNDNNPVETQIQGNDSVQAPLILETEECESMNSTNSSVEELPPVTASASFKPEDATQPQLLPSGSFPVLYPTYFSPFYPFPVSAAYVTEPPKEETHEILRPTAVHSKAAPINVNQLLGMSKLSLEESSQNSVSEPSLSLTLDGGSSSRQSAFHPNRDDVYPSIGKKDAEKYFRIPAGGTECVLQFEDEDGKTWMVKYSYNNVTQNYVFTQGWSSYVKEKQLVPGDIVFFQPSDKNSSRFFIGYRRRVDILREEQELKEVETPLQLRLPKLKNPILVISSGDDQESEETYFVSYILNELRLRSFTPCRYYLTRRKVTRNLAMLYRSRICIVIVSMNNARSQKSLDNFLAIMSHLKANKVTLIPVFFELSDDSSKSAHLGDSGQVHLGESVQKWREIISKLSVFNRYKYTKGDEIVLAKSIVRDVCSLLYSKISRNLFGIRLLLQSISPLLHCPQPSAPQIVGLWGMAGIGKTTISREIFKLYTESYDFSYFLPDFHLMCETKGLSHLRDKFFSEIFGEEKVLIDACDTKLSFTRERFLDKSILVILDGVSSARDVEALVGGFGWLSSGHTIILTSRNKQVLLQCKAKELFEIPKLSESDSFRLCCQSAIEEDWNGKISLISELVNYAGGNPLALRVLGSSVQKECIDNENEHLRRLRQYLPIEIQDAFRRSFSGLHDDEKNIFLDLACFFRGEKKYHVVNILDGCGLFTDLGIYALIDESLISLVDNTIEMPNIFQDVGRFVVCQEYEEAGKRSRLWDSNDIVDVLTNNSGTEAIEGIFLDASGLAFELIPTVFEKMYRLRLLKLYCPTSENHYKIYLPQGLYSLPDELRLLHWERYPRGSLPRNFNPKNLVELNMPYSNMTKIWKGTKNLEKLKRIILSHSRKLTKFPRLSKARNLEHIDLEGCTSLLKVNSSILHHHKLTFLSLKGCSHLRIMPPTVHLESLEVLNLSGCSELENLQDFSHNLKELYLAGTAIREMPSSIGDLTRLVTLDLEDFERLQHLPPGISNLKSMVTFKVSGCSNLKSLPNLDALFLRESVPLKLHSAIQKSRATLEVFLRAFEPASSIAVTQANWSWVRITFLPSSVLQSLASRLYCLASLSLCNARVVEIPDELCWLASLKTLDLGGNSFSQIPKSIKELRKLHSLRLRHCKNLRSLPELPRSLEILNAHNCVSLKSFPPGFEQFPRHYTFSNCFNLSPEVVREYITKVQSSLQGMAEGRQLEPKNAPAFSLCMPSSAAPKFSVDFQAGSSVRTKLTPHILMSGFTLSVVIEFRGNFRNVAGFGIKCICRKTRTDLSPTLERIFYCWAPKESPTIQKDHMFVFGCAKMHPAEGGGHDVLADLFTFEFHPVDWQNKLLDDSCMVKKCGVYLFTAARCDTTVGAKRPSSMDPWELSSVEHMEPPYKRGRFKRVIESVILSLRKRKRQKGVSTTRSLAEVNCVNI